MGGAGGAWQPFAFVARVSCLQIFMACSFCVLQRHKSKSFVDRPLPACHPSLPPSLFSSFLPSCFLSFHVFSCALLPARKANRCAPVNDSPGTFILTRKIATFRATLGKAVCPRYRAPFPFPHHCPETTHTSGHLSFVCCVDDDFLSVLNLIFISPTVVARYGFLWPSQVKSGAAPSPLLPAPSTSSCLLI